MKLIYQYKSDDNIPRKLKIEINTTEHFSVYDLVERSFNMESSWFSGKSTITTYELNELMGTKLKALYQRNKGRDLFDMWVVLKNELIDCPTVVSVFHEYCKDEKGVNTERSLITRANFERNLFEKKQNNFFRDDILDLLSDPSTWLPHEAFSLLEEKLIPLLSGKPWKSKK